MYHDIVLRFQTPILILRGNNFRRCRACASIQFAHEGDFNALIVSISFNDQDSICLCACMFENVCLYIYTEDISAINISMQHNSTFIVSSIQTTLFVRNSRRYVCIIMLSLLFSLILDIARFPFKSSKYHSRSAISHNCKRSALTV